MLDTKTDARYEYEYANCHKYELIETKKEKEQKPNQIKKQKKAYYRY